MNNNILMEIVRFGYLFLEESDNESDPESETQEKIWNFAEETIPKFKNSQFKQHFRMSPVSFEKLVIKVHNAEDHIAHRGHPELTIEKQLMMTVWYLANLESLRQVALKFGVTKSTCWDVLYRMCRKILLVNQQHGIIQWPNQNRAREIIEGFQEMSSFPGIIGSIDGCHIEILKPQDHPNSYINRKGYASILLQGVCDHKKLFLDVFTGIPGSVHDARLFHMSDLHERIENNQVIFPDNSHLVGDLAYTLTENLMVGFKDNGNLRNYQKNFNQKLSKARVVIENAFAWLKGRFRRLKLLETVRQDLIPLIIITSCILHNVCILENDLPDDLDLPREDLDQFIFNQANEHEVRNGNEIGRAKRLHIMYQLPLN